MSEKHYIAVPTAYNIYRVSDEVLQSTSGLMAQMPAAVVMETLCIRGLAKVVARIKPFDIERLKDDGEDFYNTQEYEAGPGQTEKPEEVDEEKLPGPWWKPDEDDEEEEDEDGA